MATLYGAPVSPFVRKVRVLMAEKKLSCDEVPVAPGADDPGFRAVSPLGKVPAWRDEAVGVADSSVICAYLERRHPSPALYPTEAVPYARCLWFEEYGDTRLFEVLTVGVFFERVVRPRLRGEPSDQAKIAQTLAEKVPPTFAYLEAQLDGRDYLVTSLPTLGDIAIATHFVNFGYAGEHVDAARYPRLAAFVARMLARPSFEACLASEAQFLKAMG
jgi:glutathione S-transferase